MKVLIVIEAALGGSGRHVLDLAAALMARGETVHLVYSPLRADRQFNTGLVALCKARPTFRCHSIPIARELAASDVASYVALTRYVGRNGPFDIIHSHSTKAGFLARLLLRRRGARSIYTPHGLMTLNPELQGPRRLAVCALESALARLCEAVVTVSANEYRCAIETGIDAQKLFVIPNGVNPPDEATQARQRQQIRKTLDVSPATVCIGWVGRFVDYKEPARILASFAQLKQRTSALMRLVMIGWGPLESSLRQQAADSQIVRDITFLGQVDGASNMPALDILAHTGRFEGFSYTFLEAMSAGLPIVTTRVGGTDELVEIGATGYVCDPWDTGAFAALLHRLAEQPELRSRMAISARSRAARFTVAEMVSSTADLYSRVSARPHLAPIPPAAAAESPQ